MRRRQLIEIAEQPWCPGAIRDALTDYLQFAIDRGRPYAAAAPLLATAFRTSRGGGPAVPEDGATGAPTPAGAGKSHGEAPITDVVDLGSGAGGPWRALAPALAALDTPARVCLTDRYPNTDAYARLARESGGAIRGEPRPVLADAVPADLAGFRTIFSAFHHFPPQMARRVLADAATHGAGIAVFEATRRDAPSILVTLLTPLFVLLGTPFIRPFRWSRLVWTYLVPVIPLLVLFDGVVSCLRMYTPDELRALARGVDVEGYRWEAGETRTGPIPMTYLVGYVAHGGRPEGTA